MVSCAGSLVQVGGWFASRLSVAAPPRVDAAVAAVRPSLKVSRSSARFALAHGFGWSLTLNISPGQAGKE